MAKLPQSLFVRYAIAAGSVVIAAMAAVSPSLANPEPRKPSAPLSIEAIIGADTVSSVAGTADRPAFQPSEITKLKSGLEALAAGDLATARSVRDRLPAQSLDRNLLAWAIAASGQDGVTSAEIQFAASALPGWPSMAAIQRNGELALARENLAPASVIAALAGSQPQTAEGVLLLARAYVKTGDNRAALGVLGPFWRTAKLEPKDELAIIRQFGNMIPKSDHRYRMERMHYEARVNSAERVAAFAGARELHRAWAAVTRNQGDARKLLDAVPASQHSAGYVFARTRHLRRMEKFRDAARLLSSVKLDPQQLIDPSEWWFERRVLSRELIDQGDFKLAYQVAARHQAQSPSDIADAEFHAGWYALRFLNDPNAASKHFAVIVKVANGAISQSRGYYWLGRAAEAGGSGEARRFYENAARYPTAFYGQLAMAKLGLRSAPIAFPKPSHADRTMFSRREEVEAIRRLEAAGHGWRADPFYLGLASKLDNVGELALLAVMAEERSHHIALKVGKIAASRGLDIGALAHPLGAIPASADITGPGKALAYAIARQESEFNAGAISGAGARGLLQLMPGTAKSMARKAGLSYAPQKLTSDAAYNATLGTTYLDEQLQRFDGSYVLTFAGYNAGPNRAAEWVGRYGDPRGKTLDTVIDWIERIPFTETRNYVQRVMENFQVYKMRLTGRMDVAGDLVSGQ